MLYLSRTSPPDPDSLITDPPVAAVVVRHDDHFEMRWQPTAAPVTVLAADGGVLVAETAENHAIIPHDQRAPQPTFFRLAVGAGATWRVGERLLPLHGAVNVRDVGGLMTADGRFVQYGNLIRGGALGRLTAADSDYLAALGVKLVCDLRSDEEVARRPDRLPPNDPTYLHRPVRDNSSGWWLLPTLLFQRSPIHRLLLRGYTRITIDQNAAIVGEWFSRVADPANRPALLHCTAGKDRTGIVMALLLRWLGVSEADVLADYSLSNHHWRHFRAELAPSLRPLVRLGLTVDDAWQIWMVEPLLLQKTLAYVDKKYGSLEAYLRGAAGVDGETLARLRRELLA